jgi:pyridoxal phosphate enzyme (YggS family)
MTELVNSIRERYLHTLDRIAVAAREVGREPASIRLVVVTKSQPREVVEAAIAAGAVILGENYPEEAVEKIQSIGAQSAVEWHMIGHVQSRKARWVPVNFNLMHSLDSIKLAGKLDRFAAEAGRSLPVLLEFNVGGEDSKSGWPAADESRWDELPAALAPVLGLPHLRICGLMVMPPIGGDAEASRPYFQHARRLQAFLRAGLPQADWSELSMGTSADFEAAVQEGATLVRVGTAIVGPRSYV